MASLEQMDIDINDQRELGKKFRGREEIADEKTEDEQFKFNDKQTLYSMDHTGEIIVLVDTSEADEIRNKRVKNGLYLVEKMKGVKCDEFKNIKRIDAIGVTLYKVMFNNIESANKFVSNEELSNKKLRAFIPKNFT